MDEMIQFNTGSNYSFSGVSLDKLGATEQSAVTIVIDESGSVQDFQSGIEKCIGEVVKALKHSPRKDNLVLRVLAFNTYIREIHGFKPLEDCDINDYKILPNFLTNLYGATNNAIEASRIYCKSMSDADFTCNTDIYIITDGEDNIKECKPKDIKESINACKKSEIMESIKTTLIGVNIKNQGCSRELENFKKEAGLDEYIEIDDASESSLAKLNGFISKSISINSQSLTTGTPAPSLTF